MARLGSIGTQYFNDSGDPLAGGKIHFYETGTNTPATTYSNEALTIENANPVILDAAGRQPDIFFDGDLKAVLRDSNDVLIETRDPVGCCADSTGSTSLPSGGTAGQSLVKSSDTSFDTEWRSVSDINGILVAPTKHRYWRLTIDSVDGSLPLSLNALDFRAKGAAFINGKRWDNGISVNEFVNSLSATPTSSPVGGTSDLLDGNVTDPPAPATGAAANYASLPTFVADFGNNPQAITSIRLALGGDGSPSVSGMTLAYSDDNSTYTDVGSTTGISAQPAEEWSIDYPFIQQIDAKANDDLTDFPDTPGSGGGGSALWEFDPVVKTADFTAEVGKYHFIKPSSGSTVTVTLPSSPSEGDVVLLRHIINSSSQVNITWGFGVTLEESGSTPWKLIEPTSSPGAKQEYAGLVYLDSEGWFVFVGAVLPVA